MTTRTRENLVTAAIIVAVLVCWFWPDARDLTSHIGR